MTYTDNCMMNYILSECRKTLSRFRKMNDIEIYHYMCNNFFSTDFEMIRRCSFIIYNESRLL